MSTLVQVPAFLVHMIVRPLKRVLPSTGPTVPTASTAVITGSQGCLQNAGVSMRQRRRQAPWPSSFLSSASSPFTSPHPTPRDSHLFRGPGAPLSPSTQDLPQAIASPHTSHHDPLLLLHSEDTSLLFLISLSRDTSPFWVLVAS